MKRFITFPHFFQNRLIQVLAVASFASFLLILGSSHHAYADLTQNNENVPQSVGLLALAQCATTGNATAEEQWLSPAGQPLVNTETVKAGTTVSLQLNVGVYYCDPNGYVIGTTTPDLQVETNFLVDSLSDTFGGNFGNTIVGPTHEINVMPDHTTRWYLASETFNYTVPLSATSGVDTVTEVNQSLNQFNTTNPTYEFQCVGTPPPEASTFNNGRGSVTNFSGTDVPGITLPPCPTETQSLSLTYVIQPGSGGCTTGNSCGGCTGGTSCPGPVVVPGAPPYSCDSDTLTGFASDPDNPGGPVTVYYTIDGNPPPQVVPNTNGTFTIDMSKYADGAAHTVAVLAVGASGDQGAVTDITFGPCGTVPPAPGTATCGNVTENPSLPWDPGEQVSIKAAVDFTPPLSPSPNPIPPQPGSYTTTTVNYETMSITAPGWATATAQLPGTDTTPSVTFTGTIPPTTPDGPFNVVWTFSYNVTVVTTTWIYIPPFGSKLIGFYPGGYIPIRTSSTYNVTPAATNPCTQPGGGPGGTGGGTPTTPPGTSESPIASQEIVDKPYLRVFGGDVAAGDEYCGSTVTPTMADILSWTKEGVNLAGWSGGAGTQLGAEATGVIGAFASSTNVAGANTQPPPTGLAFANVSPYSDYDAVPTPSPAIETYGGSLTQLPDGTCQTDYYGQMPTGLTAYGGGYMSGGSFTWGGGPLPGQTLAPGQHTVIYASGPVTITGNILFSGNGTGVNEQFDNIGAAPSLTLIVKGAINIDPTVTELDGIYISEPTSTTTDDGIINTCYDQTANDDNYYTLCNSPLTIDGSLVASKVTLGRTANTVSDSSKTENQTNSQAAETINYNPLLWIQTQTQLTQSYDSISSLPPINP